MRRKLIKKINSIGYMNFEDYPNTWITHLEHGIDYYDILGVERYATLGQIKKNYRARARVCHPDVNNGDDHDFKQLNSANEVLSNLEQRWLYNRALDHWYTKNPKNGRTSSTNENEGGSSGLSEKLNHCFEWFQGRLQRSYDNITSYNYGPVMKKGGLGLILVSSLGLTGNTFYHNQDRITEWYNDFNRDPIIETVYDRADRAIHNNDCYQLKRVYAELYRTEGNINKTFETLTSVGDSIKNNGCE